MAGSDEILVLVAQFHGTGGVDPVPRIVRHLEEHLAKIDLTNVRIEHVSDAPIKDDEAQKLGEMCKASLVIWGTYDDYGITPHYEVTREEEPGLQKVPLEEVANLPSQPDRFTLYITRGLPEEMTYLTLFTIGQIQYLGYQYEEALDTFNHALQTATIDTTHESRQEHIYFLMGNIYKVRRVWQESIENYTRTIEFDPNYSIAYNNRGNVYADLGEYDRAMADYTEAIRIDPEFAEAYYNRGVAYADLAEYKEAIADYTEAIRIDPNLALAYNNRGLAHLELGEYEEAIADFTEAIRIDPDSAEAYNNRGLAHTDLAEYGQAIADYTEAIRIDGDLALAYHGRGLAHRKLEEYEEAIADFTEAIRIDPNLALAYYNRGVARYDLGKYEEAITDFESYMLLAPPDAQPSRACAQQYIEEMQEYR
jgi:tetratricopeptide (TPR) repeat protein